MDDEITYICGICQSRKKAKSGDKNPVCCTMEMKPLDTCTKDPAFAEHARFNDKDEPCDDGR